MSCVRQAPYPDTGLQVGSDGVFAQVRRRSIAPIVRCSGGIQFCRGLLSLGWPTFMSGAMRPLPYSAG